MNRKVSKVSRRNHTRGFTLLEILVASIVGAFVAVTATTALRSTMSSRQKIADYTTATAQLRFAAEMIRKDMINFYRDADLNNVKLLSYADFTDYGAADNIVFHTVNWIKARPEYPEGDVYEVEYGLVFNEDDKPFFMRRLWPNPVILDPTLEETLPPMGVVTILSENIVSFDVQFYFEEQWFDEWPEEMTGQMPDLIAVSLTYQPQGRVNTLTHNFFVNFPRWPGGEGGGAAIDMSGSGQTPTGGTAPGIDGATGPGSESLKP